MLPFANARRLVALGSLPWPEINLKCTLLGATYAVDYEGHAYYSDLRDVILTQAVTGMRVDDKGYCMADTVQFHQATFGRDVWQFALWVDAGIPVRSPLFAHHRFDVRWPSNLLPLDYGLFWDAQFGGLFRA
jgi:hypothetical protein